MGNTTSTTTTEQPVYSSYYPGPGIHTDCNLYGLYGSKSCGSDREYKDGLCYLKPNPGFSCTATVCTYGSLRSEIGTIPNQCPQGYVFRDGMCWPSCPQGFEDSLITCKKPIIIGNPTPLICPVGYEQKGGLCYSKCSDGYSRKDSDLEYCSTTCPDGLKDIGIGGCEKIIVQKKDKGICPSDRRLENGLCYNIPKVGFQCTATSCTKANIRSQIGVKPIGCSGNRVKRGELCYDPCPVGYERRDDNIEYCTSICPEGYNSTITGCERPKTPLN